MLVKKDTAQVHKEVYIFYVSLVFCNSSRCNMAHCLWSARILTTSKRHLFERQPFLR